MSLRFRWRVFTEQFLNRADLLERTLIESDLIEQPCCVLDR